MRPFARVVLAALSAIILGYPIAANSFLWLGGVQKLFESTDSVKIDFRRAWSIWPGRVHLTDVLVVAQDSNVEFSLILPEAVVDVRLRDLARRTFHATRVRGSGLVFRFRHRVQPASAQTPFIRAYPPIGDFEDPPLKAAGPPTPPLDEAHYNLWTIHMEDVDVGIRELWTLMFRYQGPGRATGAFRLRPAKRLWVGPATLELGGGTVETGPHEVLRDFAGTIVCKVDDFDAESAKGMEPFRFISARTDLSGSVSSLAFLGFLAPALQSLELADGSGALDVKVGLDHGVFTNGSSVAYRTVHAEARISKRSFGLNGEVAVVGAVDDGSPRVSIDIPRAWISTANGKSNIELASTYAAARADNADATRDWGFAGADADVSALLPDVRAVHELPGAERRRWAFESGRGYARAVASLSPDEKLDARVEAAIHESKGYAGALHWSGSARAQATFHGRAGPKGELVARMSADRLKLCSEDGFCTEAPTTEATADLAMSPGGPRGAMRAEAKSLVATVGMTRISADLFTATARVAAEGVYTSATADRVSMATLGSCPFAEARRITLEGDVAGRAQSALASRGAIEGFSVRWGSFDARSDRAVWSASLDDESLSTRVKATAVELTSSGGAPKGWQAAIQEASVDARLHMAESIVRGPMRLTLERASGQIGKTKVQGDLIADLDVSSDPAPARAADVSGRIALANVGLLDGADRVSNWWAELELPKMHVDARQNLDFAGKLVARFRDGLPMLYVLASQDQIPSWTPKLLPLRALTLDLYVERYCRWTDVQIAGAEGGPLRAAGRVQVSPGDTHGSVLVQLTAAKPIALGVDFREDDSDTSVAAGQRWLEEHLANLTRAATEKHDAVCEPEPPTCE